MKRVSITERLQAYYRLTKPGIVRGNLFTAAAGYFLASRMHMQWLAFAGLLVGTALVIASSCVINNYFDRSIDKKMARTKKRALVTGSIPSLYAIIYAVFLGITGYAVLAVFTNWLTVLAGFSGMALYLVAYSIGKRTTVYGTIIGSLSGAVPPLAGYLAASNQLNLGAWLIFATIALWQMPHFYAIAIYRRDEYAAAGLPIWSVKLGTESTRKQILIFIVLFALVAPLLSVFDYAGWVYGVAAIVLAVYWLYTASTSYHKNTPERWARKMFGISLLVMTLLSLAIPLDGLIALI